MGSYINPPNESKEEFLDREGEKLDKIPRYEDIPSDKKLVIWIHNGAFTAAAIAFNFEEYACFVETQDKRPKYYFLVETEKLLEVSDLKNYLRF